MLGPYGWDDVLKGEMGFVHILLLFLYYNNAYGYDEDDVLRLHLMSK